MSNSKVYHLFGDDDVSTISNEELHKLDEMVKQGKMRRHDHLVTFEELDARKAEVQSMYLKSECRLSSDELRKKIAKNKKRLLNSKDD